MKKIIQILSILTILTGITYQTAFCQSTKKVVKKQPYKVWVKPMDQSKTIKGYLGNVNDSSIVVLQHYTRGNQTIPAQRIRLIQLRKKGRVGKGTLIGALIGGTFGAAIYSTQSDVTLGNNSNFTIWTKGQQIFFGSVFFGTTGAVLGSLISSFKINVPIGGKQSTYETQQKMLEKYQLY